METIDDETSAAAIDFMQRQARANTPFFCWFNSTRMHFRTHVRDDHRDQPGTDVADRIRRRHDRARRDDRARSSRRWTISASPTTPS